VFDHYYQAELSHLRELGRSFAHKHPALAGMLAERSTDPDVERLLEGFAFVAARLRQRIDDAVPELIESLVELLLPHGLRPTPAATIVEFRASSKALRGRVRVERGTRLLSKPVHGTRCTFTTTRAVDVLPVRLVSSRLEDGASTRPELTLRFEAEPGSEPAIYRREGLRLHLHGEHALTTQLYLWLARHLSGVSLRAADGASIELGAGVVRLVGFDTDDALLPWPAFSSQSARVLLEYFTLPSKFLFVDVVELDRAAHLASSGFELVLRFSNPPPLPSRLPEHALRLHAAPVVNLFDVGAEPVRAGLDERATLLRAAGLDPSHMEVFSVEGVLGIAPGAERRAYQPFHSFQQASMPAADFGYYKLTRQPSPVDDGTHTSITLHRAPESTLVRERETLSIELLCTNRGLTTELHVGDIATPSSDLPSGLSFSNIARLSPPLRAPLGSDLLWQLVSQLAVTRRSLADRDALLTLLSSYRAHDRSDLADARAQRARLGAIRSVCVETVTRVVGGVAARGSLYRVELEQAGFASEGDAYLFGAVLHRLLALDAHVNTFADLQVTLTPTQLGWRYAAEVDR
jgi:type VI secretion system protein ImpG